jgi:hypothetical protein
MNTLDRLPPRSLRAPFSLIIALIATIAASNLAAKPGNGKGNENAGGNGNGKGNGQSADFIPPGHRRAPVEIVVKQAPPAVRVEVAPARPSAGHVWVPGFWAWEANAYTWTPSIWVLPPEPAAVWVAPRYESRAGVSIMITGFWRL